MAAEHILVTPTTQYILSTSGRPASMKRYRILLTELLGLDVAYLPISSPAVDGKISPEHFAMALRGLNSVGGAISRDIKSSILQHLDEVDPLARRIGAVNTVLRRGEKLVGFNTDACGFDAAIRNRIEGHSVESAVVYGYGGVTAVVVAVLTQLGIRVAITGRRPEAAASRARELGAELFTPGFQAQLFVNAAPVTDSPLADAPGFLEALESSGCSFVFDHEMPGKFLAEHCASHGLHHIPGTDMYHPQMIAQWGLFLEGRVPEGTDIAALLKLASRD